MTFNYMDIIESAFDLIQAQDAIDLGQPTEGAKRAALNRLMKVASEIASENEGRLPVPETPDGELHFPKVYQNLEPAL